MLLQHQRLSMVYLVLFLSTVLTRMCAILFLTAEMNRPFLEPSALCNMNTWFKVHPYFTFYFVCTLFNDKMFAIPTGWKHKAPPLEVSIFNIKSLSRITEQDQNKFGVMDIHQQLSLEKTSSVNWLFNSIHHFGKSALP